MGEAGYFLTVNAGSSSLKFCLFDTDTLDEAYAGTIAGIGFESATFTTTEPDVPANSRELKVDGNQAAVQIMQEHLKGAIVGVRHRVVHGEPVYRQSVVIDDEVVEGLPERTGNKGAHLKEEMKRKLIEHREYINQHGVDMPLVHDWE
jgi:acetate kinase